MALEFDHPPLIFTKTGTIGTEPLGFYEKLADAYDADLVAHDDAMLELTPDGEIVDFDNGALRRAASRMINNQAIDALNRGVNVVYDTFLNSPRTRGDFRHRIVVPTGAVWVPISTAISLRTARDRIEERYKKDELPIPSDQWARPPMGLVQGIYKSVKWPGPDEPRLLVLEGERTTEEFLPEVAAFVEECVAAAQVERAGE
ncbi:MAG TPA: hypothetical protein VHB51_00540 [Candidatus Saccharimonadales bacterium]|nr:hypothetical protein [Candidatus Saccharimonadales bacterium]